MATLPTGEVQHKCFRRGRAQRASTVLHNPCREDNRIPSLATDARYEVSNAPVFRPDAGRLNSRGDRRERVVSIQRRGTVLEEAGILAERVARRIELGVESAFWKVYIWFFGRIARYSKVEHARLRRSRTP